MSEEAYTAVAEAMQRLAEGREVDIALWQAIAAAEATSAPLRVLARMASASTAEKCRELAVAVDDFEAPAWRIAGQALAAQRRIELGDDGSAVVAERAHALFSLASLYRGSSAARSFLLRAVEDFNAAVERSLAAGDRQAALGHAIGFAAAANSSSAEPTVASRLPVIFTLLLDLAVDERGEGTPRALLAGNLITTCFRVAEADAARRAEYLSHAIRLGELALDVIERGDVRKLPPPLLRQVILSSIAAMLRGHTELAREEPNRFVAHASEIQQAAERARTIAVASEDAEMRTMLLALIQSASSALEEKTGSGEEPDSELLDSTQARVSELAADAARIAEATDSQTRRRLLESVVTPLFDELEDLLASQIAQVGVNHRICRFLAGLGAIAGGRIGSLSSVVVMPWIMAVSEPEGSASERQFARRQQMVAPFEESATLRLGAALSNLAGFADKLSASRNGREDVRMVLRGQFRHLLGALLQRPGVATVIDRELAPIDDSQVLLASVPEAVRINLVDAYRGLSAGSAMPLLPLPVRRRKRVSASPDEKKVAAAPREQPAPGREELLHAMANRLTGTPMDLVGTTFETSGGQYVVIDLAGEGESKVVFTVRHEESGERFAVAIYKR
ncbi:MAG: hypothetical protein QOH21_3071 [Acidobacteriota bacterium]|jgi:hypothetical protein|nr:hypothetical protein [Acidobacteriota bacterium]